MILLVCLFLAGNTVGSYLGLTSQRQLHVWDLQPLWQAGRWIVQERGDPYSSELAEVLQMQSYGRLAEEGEDNRAFAYPLYILFVLTPVLLLPLPWAQAAWFTVLLSSMLVGVAGATRLARWRLSTLLSVSTFTWACLLYPNAWALALGQVSILISGLTIATLLAVKAGRDGWAGVCLALTTAKPQMAFLLVPALLLWSLGRRRFRLALSFAIALGLLLLASFAVRPGWVTGVLRVGAGYYDLQPFPSPVALLAETVAGAWHGLVTWALTALLLAALAVAWWRERHSSSLPLEAVGLVLVVTALIAPRTSLVNQAPLLLPLCLLFAGWSRRGRGGRALTVAVQGALLVGLWLIDLAWFPPLNSGAHWHAQHRVISPILPTLLLVAATRRWCLAWRAKRVA